MIEADEIRKRLSEAMPDATIEIEDLTGGADHYRVSITSATFEGMAALARHRHVYSLLGDVMGGALHALALETRTPSETSSS